MRKIEILCEIGEEGWEARLLSSSPSVEPKGKYARLLILTVEGRWIRKLDVYSWEKGRWQWENGGGDWEAWVLDEVGEGCWQVVEEILGEMGLECPPPSPSPDLDELTEADRWWKER